MTPRLRSLISATAAMAGDITVLLFALLTTWASFAVDEPDAYAFPQLLSLLLLLFAVINVTRVARAAPKSSPPLTVAVLIKIAPAVGVVVAYLAVAETLGFYFSAFISFALLSFLYGGDVGKDISDKSRVRNAIIAATVFIATLYALFSLLLSVQLPRGVFL